MKINVLFFGVTTDLVNTTAVDLNVDKAMAVLEFKLVLKSKYPQLENLDTFAIAVNEVYADDSLVLQENDTIAIIPPVSGG